MGRSHGWLWKILGLMLWINVNSVFALTAKVTLVNGTPLAGVAVKFAHLDTTLLSDAMGNITFGVPVSTRLENQAANPIFLKIVERNLFLNLPHPENVDLRIYALSGRTLFTSMQLYGTGVHRMSLPYLAHGMYVLKATIGKHVVVQKINSLLYYQWVGEKNKLSLSSRLAKVASTQDTAFFTKIGLAPVYRTLGSYRDSLGVVVMDTLRGPPTLVKAVSVGDGYSMIISSDNTLWATGDQYFGRLGASSRMPAPVASGVIAVSAGYQHTAFVKQDSSLWAVGYNKDGQLGFKSSGAFQSTPKQIATGVKSVSAGNCFTMIIKNDNSLWGTGYNGDGVLGLGDTLNRDSLTFIMNDVADVSVSKVYQCALILKKDGTLWGTGYNGKGQLGLGQSLKKVETPLLVMSDVAAVSVGELHTMIVKIDHSLWCCGDNSYGQFGGNNKVGATTPVRIMDSISAVFAGSQSSLFLKQDNSLWGVGVNFHGQLGLGDTLDRMTPELVMRNVESASSFVATMIIKQDGTLWATGLNNSGQLGVNTFNTNKRYPVQVFANHSHGLTVSDGFGSGSYSMDTVVTITANDSTANKRGFVHWGGSDSGNVLVKNSKKTTFTMPDKPALVKAVYADMYQLSVVDGTGSGYYLPGDTCTVVANDSTNANRIFDHWGGPDSVIVFNVNVKSTSMIMPGTNALLRPIYHQGFRVTYDKNGGEVDAKPVQSPIISSGRKVGSLPQPPTRSGFLFTGWNRKTDGSGTQFSDTSIVADSITVYALWVNEFSSISAGGEHTMMLGKDGSLWATGYNNFGQLGDNTKITKRTPIIVSKEVSEVSAGMAFTIILKNNGTAYIAGSIEGIVMDGVTAVSASSAYYHSIFRKNDNTLWGVGGNTYGQLGTGDNLDRSLPVKISDSVTAVFTGCYLTYFIKSDGWLWATGRNPDGQFGLGDTINRKVPVQVMQGVSCASGGEAHSLFLKTDGTLWTCGNNMCGQLGTGDTMTRTKPTQIASGVKTISAGSKHSVFVKNDGSLWGMGLNCFGQLGVGDVLNRKTPVKIMDDVSAVSAGWDFTIVLKTDGSVWGFGENSWGKLGDGTTTDKKLPIKIVPLP